MSVGFYNSLSITNQIFGRTWQEKHVKLIAFAVDKIGLETRYYHSLDNHIIPLLQQLLDLRNADRHYFTLEKTEIIYWSILYHDIILDPRITGGLNEKQSADLWASKVEELYAGYTDKVKVYDIIMATYGHESEDRLTRIFLKMDLNGFTQDLKGILEDELLVRKEYEFYDWSVYKKGRIEFLKKYAENSVIKEMGVSKILLQQASYMEFLTPNIAVYLGSFYPFHVGHMDVVKKGEAIFDKVIIVFAENSAKPCEAFINKIVPKALQNRQVEFVSGSIIKWIENLEYPVTILRGLRNSTDLQYEQNYLTWLAEASTKPFKAVTVFADKKLEHISSSAIKALAAVEPEKAKKYIFE